MSPSSASFACICSSLQSIQHLLQLVARLLQVLLHFLCHQIWVMLLKRKHGKSEHTWQECFTLQHIPTHWLTLILATTPLAASRADDSSWMAEAASVISSAHCRYPATESSQHGTHCIPSPPKPSAAPMTHVAAREWGWKPPHGMPQGLSPSQHVVCCNDAPSANTAMPTDDTRHQHAATTRTFQVNSLTHYLLILSRFVLIRQKQFTIQPPYITIGCHLLKIWRNKPHLVNRIKRLHTQSWGRTDWPWQWLVQGVSWPLTSAGQMVHPGHQASSQSQLWQRSSAPAENGNGVWLGSKTKVEIYKCSWRPYLGISKLVLQIQKPMISPYRILKFTNICPQETVILPDSPVFIIESDGFMQWKECSDPKRR